MEAWREREEGLMDRDNSVVIVGGGGVNGDEKNTINFFLRKKESEAT